MTIVSEQAVYSLRQKINDYLVQRTGGRVQSGPFAGMLILPEAAWSYTDLASKLLGVYEQELHPAIFQAPASNYGAFVNIGSAEGYYAVGMARLCHDLPVYAYDIDQEALALLKKNAAANGVEDRVETRGKCTAMELCMHAVEHRRMLVVCDCEGGELELFANEQIVLACRESDLLIECHDFLDPFCTPKVLAYLWRTHKVEIIYSSGRDPNNFPILSHFSDFERWMAVCENRPRLMSWLLCRAR